MSALIPEIAIQIQNDSGSIIPARSVVVCTSVEMVQTGPGQETIAVHHVTQYTGQAGNIYVTGPEDIPATNSDTSAFPGSRVISEAYSDQFIYVAIDQAIAVPKSGEQWGPVPNQWYVSRGGLGFFAEGHPASNGDPAKSMFLRDRGWAWGKLTTTQAAGSAASPTFTTFDIWHPDQTSVASPKPLIKALNTGLQGLQFVNYDASLTGAANYICKVERGYEGLSVYWEGCLAS
jgi:hypothetical protein